MILKGKKRIGLKEIKNSKELIFGVFLFIELSYFGRPSDQFGF